MQRKHDNVHVLQYQIRYEGELPKHNNNKLLFIFGSVVHYAEKLQKARYFAMCLHAIKPCAKPFREALPL